MLLEKYFLFKRSGFVVGCISVFFVSSGAAVGCGRAVAVPNVEVSAPPELIAPETTHTENQAKSSASFGAPFWPKFLPLKALDPAGGPELANFLPSSEFGSPEIADAPAGWLFDSGLFVYDLVLWIDQFGLNRGRPSSDKRWFLFWPNSLWGRPISSATYIHRVYRDRLVNEEKEQVFASAPAAISFDQVSQRWSVPLSELFMDTAYTSDDILERDIQELQLDLVSEQGDRQTLRIQFQVMPTLAAVNIGQSSLQSLSNDSESIVGSSLAPEINQGWVVGTHHLSNPTGRRFVVWLKIEDPAVLHKSSFFCETVRPDPRLHKLIQYQTREHNGQVNLTIDYVRLSTQAGIETRIIGADQWLQVPIEAHQSLKIDWIARTSSLAHLDRPEPLEFHYPKDQLGSVFDLISMGVDVGGSPGSPWCQLVKPWKPWVITGLRIEGSFSVKICLSLSPDGLSHGFRPTAGLDPNALRQLCSQNMRVSFSTGP